MTTKRVRKSVRPEDAKSIHTKLISRIEARITVVKGKYVRVCGGGYHSAIKKVGLELEGGLRHMGLRTADEFVMTKSYMGLPLGLPERFLREEARALADDLDVRRMMEMFK
jgi:hypothetical protein